MLARQAAAAVGREKLLLRCRRLGRASHFGAHGAQGNIVAAARLQLVYVSFQFQVEINVP